MMPMTCSKPSGDVPQAGRKTSSQATSALAPRPWAGRRDLRQHGRAAAGRRRRRQRHLAGDTGPAPEMSRPSSASIYFRGAATAPLADALAICLATRTGGGRFTAAPACLLPRRAISMASSPLSLRSFRPVPFRSLHQPRPGPRTSQLLPAAVQVTSAKRSAVRAID